MTTETVVMTDRTPVSFWTKLNPLWWLVGPDGWDVPTINNGEPYLPDVTNIWLRRFYWFICRNPLMNFVGFIIGVEDNNYRAVGTTPVVLTTWRDATPPQTGWKWAVLWPQFSVAAFLMTQLWITLALTVHPAFYALAAWAFLKSVGPLPFVSYNGSVVESYLGWRPASGGFGFKFVLHGAS